MDERNSFLCPILSTRMTDPVIAKDGRTYERSAIEQWFRTHNTSPLTGLRIPTDLIPNRTLKDAMDEDARTVTATATDVTMAVPLPVSLTVTEHEDRIRCVASGDLAPVYVILVLDVSKSMDEKGSTGNRESEASKYTRLELVIHACLTVIETLGPNDSVSIVTFSDGAHTVLTRTKMTPGGKDKARECIKAIESDSATNLWAGIKSAYGLASGQTSIIVLTDGCPTDAYCPRAGYESSMKEITKKDVTLHTCGFGYELDTDLLRELAIIGRGTFNFIPDGSMIGTVFVHFLANIKFTVYPHAQAIATNGEVGHIGDIRKGIPIYMDCDGKDIDKITSSDRFVEFNRERAPFERPIPASFSLTLHKAISLGQNRKIQQGSDLIFEYASTLPPGDLKDDIFHTSSEKGQICKAFDAWKHNQRGWGYPYLVAVSMAHSKQLKVNFKDKSMLAYSTTEFEDFVEKGMTAFATIPPPQSAVRREAERTRSTYGSPQLFGSVRAGHPAYGGPPSFSSQGHGSLFGSSSGGASFGSSRGGVQMYGSVSRPIYTSTGSLFGSGGTMSVGSPSFPPPGGSLFGSGATLSMATLSNRDTGCFSGSTIVLYDNGEEESVRSLRKGDILKGGFEVECVVEHKSRAIAYEVGDYMWLTAWHPFRRDSRKWEFPDHIYSDGVETTVYNLVLTSGHYVQTTDGTEAVTLGHGMEGEVVSHPYLGTRACIDDLKALPGYADGRVTVNNLERGKDGLICKYL